MDKSTDVCEFSLDNYIATTKQKRIIDLDKPVNICEFCSDDRARRVKHECDYQERITNLIEQYESERDKANDYLDDLTEHINSITDEIKNRRVNSTDTVNRQIECDTDDVANILEVEEMLHLMCKVGSVKFKDSTNTFKLYIDHITSVIQRETETYIDLYECVHNIDRDEYIVMNNVEDDIVEFKLTESEITDPVQLLAYEDIYRKEYNRSFKLGRNNRTNHRTNRN